MLVKLGWLGMFGLVGLVRLGWSGYVGQVELGGVVQVWIVGAGLFGLSRSGLVRLVGLC